MNGETALVPVIMVEEGAWGDVSGLAEKCFDTVTSMKPEGFRQGEVTLLFTGDAQVQKLNAAFRNRDQPTNVLSFPAGDPLPGMPPEAAGTLGDIALARETCEREALEKGISREAHTSHLIIHGLLHIFGYTHERDDDAVIMETLETALMAEMGLENPYAEKEIQ